MLAGPGLFRLFLAMLVVIQHLSRVRIGITAVMIFFMLSGFWVCKMYCEKYRVTSNPLLRFYASRFLRLWPPFLAAMGLAFVLALMTGHPLTAKDLFAIPMLGVASHTHDPLGVSWSLDIEMQFYLIMPLLVAALARKPQKRVAIALLGVSALSITLYFVTQVEIVGVYLLVFSAGMLVYLTGYGPSPRAAMASAAAFVAIGLLFSLWPETQGLVIGEGWSEVPAHIAAMIWALVLLPFVAWSVRQPSPSIDRKMGDFSYSLYLTHYPVIVAINDMTPGDMQPQDKIMALAAILVVAIAFYTLVDVPLERRRKALVLA